MRCCNGEWISFSFYIDFGDSWECMDVDVDARRCLIVFSTKDLLSLYIKWEQCAIFELLFKLWLKGRGEHSNKKADICCYLTLFANKLIPVKNFGSRLSSEQTTTTTAAAIAKKSLCIIYISLFLEWHNLQGGCWIHRRAQHLSSNVYVCIKCTI